MSICLKFCIYLFIYEYKIAKFILTTSIGGQRPRWDVDIDREYGNLAFNELSPLGADTLGTGHSKSRARAEQAVPRRGFDNSAAQFRSAQK